MTRKTLPQIRMNVSLKGRSKGREDFIGISSFHLNVQFFVRTRCQKKDFSLVHILGTFSIRVLIVNLIYIRRVVFMWRVSTYTRVTNLVWSYDSFYTPVEDDGRRRSRAPLGVVGGYLVCHLSRVPDLVVCASTTDSPPWPPYTDVVVKRKDETSKETPIIYRGKFKCILF